jgi:hypothetical protein
MSLYSPVTEEELARARSDPAFRQKLLSQSLDALLVGLRTLRGGATPEGHSASPKQIREGVELAVRLAELIQNPRDRSRGR